MQVSVFVYRVRVGTCKMCVVLVSTCKCDIVHSHMYV